MATRKPKGSRRIHRFTTKQGSIGRPAHLGRWIALILTAVLTVIAALALGTHLKAKSDAHRAEVEKGQWTLEDTVIPANPVSVPDIRAVSIIPEGNVGDILIAGKHGGIILPLQDKDGTLYYTSEVASAARLAMNASPVSLSADVARVQKRDLNVTCTLLLTWTSEPTPALRAYRRGLELALLREYAEAGMDDLLLTGLPAGSEDFDRITVAFLEELRALLSELENPPAVGVALSPDAFATDATYTPPLDPTADVEAGIPAGTAPLYAGNISPSRIRNACDYLAMDLRDKTSEEAAAILPHIRYAYARHSLRLLMDKTDTEAVADALSHGFARIFEMEPRMESATVEGQP
jgi:hypothetical protein